MMKKAEEYTKTMEVNIRAVYGFRSIGIGHTLLTKLSGYLNMPPAMNKSSYDHMSKLIKVASKTVAEKAWPMQLQLYV